MEVFFSILDVCLFVRVCFSLWKIFVACEQTKKKKRFLKQAEQQGKECEKNV